MKKNSFEKALGYAYRLLNIRPRSIKEISQRLREKNYSISLIEEVINELKRRGELNDLKFAKMWIENRMSFNPKGSRALRHELREKGLTPDDIDAVLSDARLEFNEYEIAKRLINSVSSKKKIHALLYRRGFEFDIINRILEELE